MQQAIDVDELLSAGYACTGIPVTLALRSHHRPRRLSRTRGSRCSLP